MRGATDAVCTPAKAKCHSRARIFDIQAHTRWTFWQQGRTRNECFVRVPYPPMAARNRSPYFSAFTRPTPDTLSRPSRSVGFLAAMSANVAFENTM